MTSPPSKLGAGSIAARPARWHRMARIGFYRWPCRFALVLGVAIGSAQAQSGIAVAPTSAGTAAPRHAVLRWVASSKVFNNVNRDDARAALKISSDGLARQEGYILDSTVDIVDTVAEIRERLRQNTVELATLGVTDYLDLESTKLLVPVMTDVRMSQSGPHYSYVLLVSPASTATSLAALRGKNVLVWARGTGILGAAWLEVLLAKHNLGRARSFFAAVKPVPKPQACILPLFFGKVDACLVDEVNFNVAKEMNPQLGRLKVLARSAPLLESIIAVPAEPHPFQKDLLETMLDQTPLRHQLLMVFKTDHLVRLQPGDLDSARELWKDFCRLGEPPNR